ncbi:MAG: DNA repair protein RadC [Bacteroidales bacterium]|nr:DNA repair protein RadC [Bacteroidales bacterium]MCL2133198.1 DNA repair protein RadC [Bacteroidales bacterium]
MINTLKLKEWSADDKPREKFLLKGPAALSDTELIALVLRSGTPPYPVQDIAKQIMAEANNSLKTLKRLPLQQFQQIKGVGTAKAVSILAAFELGQRAIGNETVKEQPIAKSQDVYNLMAPIIRDLDYEEFWILALNGANKVVAKQKIGQGGVNITVADPKIIFKFALENLATGIILVHNHPSGNNIPSNEDKLLTHRLREAGKLLTVNVIDHIIIAGNSYYSFIENELT